MILAELLQLGSFQTLYKAGLEEQERMSFALARTLFFAAAEKGLAEKNHHLQTKALGAVAKSQFLQYRAEGNTDHLVLTTRLAELAYTLGHAFYLSGDSTILAVLSEALCAASNGKFSEQAALMAADGEAITLEQETDPDKIVFLTAYDLAWARSDSGRESDTVKRIGLALERFDTLVSWGKHHLDPWETQVVRCEILENLIDAHLLNDDLAHAEESLDELIDISNKLSASGLRLRSHLTSMLVARMETHVFAVKA